MPRGHRFVESNMERVVSEAIEEGLRLIVEVDGIEPIVFRFVPLAF